MHIHWHKSKSQLNVKAAALQNALTILHCVLPSQKKIKGDSKQELWNCIKMYV